MTSPTEIKQANRVIHRKKANLLLRTRIIQAIRVFFSEKGYLEVDTPCRIPAPPPEAHNGAVPSVYWVLQTSPELCMKRLLAAGYERVFQVCKCFRSMERGQKHLPELTMLEWYTAGDDYFDMMKQCEELVRFTARSAGKGEFLSVKGRKIPLHAPWTRISVAEAFDRFASISMEQALLTNRFDEVMGCEIEPELGWAAPLFLFDYPAAMGSLARLKPSDHRLAERFELYIGGVELCNAFTELTDPVEQRLRFEEEMARRRSAGRTVYPLPQIFLRSLSAMPDAAGNALGIDRLVMLFAGTDTIGDVVAFTPEEL